MDLTDQYFTKWLKQIFGHPVTTPEWNRSQTSNRDTETSHSLAIACLTRACEDAQKVFNPFSNAQLKQGFTYLISPSASNFIFCLTDRRIRWADRKRCLESFFPLYKGLFLKRCSSYLS